MKGISLCADCASYDLKKHKCNRGATVDPDISKGQDVRFYVDCPLDDVEPVRHGRWLAVSSYEAYGGDYITWCSHGNPVAYWYCSECEEEAYVSADDEFILSDFCPHCGADMRGGVKNDRE